MNKYEFVQSLRRALTGKIDGRELEDTIRYYEDYIDTEIKKGKSESQVLSELGDPRLIAKNIISVKGNSYTGEEDSRAARQVWQEEDYKESKKKKIPGWLIALLIVLAVIVIFGIAFSVIWSLLPIIIPIFLIVSICRFFFNRR